METDTTYVGGTWKNKPKSDRAKMEGRGPRDMTAVTDVKDRKTNRVVAKVVDDTKGDTLREFLDERVEPGALALPAARPPMIVSIHAPV